MEFIFSDYLVSCETGDCENQNVEILVKALADSPNVICGVCGLAITNITPTEEEIGAL
jgi:transcription elongation factor Elf1